MGAVCVPRFGRAFRVGKRPAGGKIRVEGTDASDGESFGGFDAVKNDGFPDLQPVCDVPRCRLTNVSFEVVFGSPDEDVSVCREYLVTVGVEKA
jgi:hypothetical protein